MYVVFTVSDMYPRQAVGDILEGLVSSWCAPWTMSGWEYPFEKGKVEGMGWSDKGIILFLIVCL